jgi:hypothetical protein
MKRGPRIAVVIVVAIAAVIAGQWYFAISREAPPAAGEGTAAPSTPAAPPPAPAPQPAAAQAPAASSDGDGLRRVPIPPVDTRAPAWISLAQSRESGDDRAPPIEHSAHAEHPDASLLADHDAYAAYQLAQKERLAAAYVQAATPEVAKLQADLERGREAGIPPDQLAHVAEKIRRIEQQRKAADAMLSKSKEQ